MRHWQRLTVAATSLMVVPAFGAGEDDPLLTSVTLEHLEYRQDGDQSLQVLEGDAWVGQDLNKLWFKVDAEYAEEMEGLEVQALYNRALSSYWDVQMGVRQDFEPTPSRTWAVLALHGLAPYFLEVDASLFVGESGRTALRLEAEYEMHITQQLILSPQVEVDFYGQDDEALHIGSGLSSAEAGLRLRYEIRREFAPYVGVSWEKHFGHTADKVEHAGGEVSETQWLLGLRAWF